MTADTEARLTEAQRRALHAPDDGGCVRCSAVPRTASGLCNTCLDEDAERAGEIHNGDRAAGRNDHGHR